MLVFVLVLNFVESGFVLLVFMTIIGQKMVITMYIPGVIQIITLWQFMSVLVAISLRYLEVVVLISRYKPKGNIATLLYWASEREVIRLKKRVGTPPPWTDDPILQTYRFCNVRRRDDRVSMWLRENVLRHQAEFEQSVFFQWVALCRWVNWPPTIQAIIEADLVVWNKIDLPRIGEIIESQVKAGTKAWTGAYMVRAPSKRKYPNISKGKFVSEIVVGALNSLPVWNELAMALLARSCERTWSVLFSLPNWGSFMAGQITADLTYTPYLSGAYDLLTWAPQGPGSRRGFNRLMGRPLKQKIDNHEWLERLQAWRDPVAKVAGVDLNLMDLQNCLCEVDKYLRVKNGEGRPRSTYKPETAYS